MAPRNRSSSSTPRTGHAQVREPFSRHYVRDTDFDALERAERSARQGYMAPWVTLVQQFLAKESHLASLHELRCSAVTREWQVVPGGPEPEDAFAAAFVAEQIARVGEERWRSHLVAQAEALSFGYAAAEIIWAREGGDIVLQDLIPVAPEYFKINVPGLSHVPGTGVYALILSIDGLDEALLPDKWVVTTAPGTAPLPQRGLLHPAARLALTKLRALGYWVMWDERNGLPFVFASMETDTPTESQKRALKALVEHFGADGGGYAWGAKVNITTVESTSRGPADGHASLISQCERDMSKLYLGGTLVNDVGSSTSTRALGEVHAANTQGLIHAHALSLEAANEEHLFRPLLAFNGIRAATPKMRLQVRPHSEPTTWVGLAKVLSELGLPLSADQIREITGIRAPRSSEDACTGAAPQVTP